MIDWEKLTEAFAEITKSMAEMIDRIRNAFEATEDHLEDYIKWKKKQVHLRASWHVPADTRLKSQVLMNKPRNLVRKVIR